MDIVTKHIEEYYGNIPDDADKVEAAKHFYEQAEKDLALTWQDVAILITIYEQEVEAGNICRYEDEGAPSLKEAGEIILRRFNELVKQLKQEQL